MSTIFLVQNGDTYVWHVSVINNSHKVNPGVTGQFTTPDGMVVDSGVISKGTFNTVSKLWTIGDMDPYETVTIDITLRVTDITKAPLDVAFEAIGTVPALDSNLDNNQSSIRFESICDIITECAGQVFGDTNTRLDNGRIDNTDIVFDVVDVLNGLAPTGDEVRVDISSIISAFTDTNTRLHNGRLIGTTLRYDIIDVKDGNNVIGTVDADLSALVSAAADGNGIYDGSDTIPSTTVATVTDDFIVRLPASLTAYSQPIDLYVGDSFDDTYGNSWPGIGVRYEEAVNDHFYVGVVAEDPAGFPHAIIKGEENNVGIDSHFKHDEFFLRTYSSGSVYSDITLTAASGLFRKNAPSGTYSFQVSALSAVMSAINGANTASVTTTSTGGVDFAASSYFRFNTQFNLPVGNPTTEGLGAGVYAWVVDQTGTLAGTGGWQDITGCSIAKQSDFSGLTSGFTVTLPENAYRVTQVVRNGDPIPTSQWSHAINSDTVTVVTEFGTYIPAGESVSVFYVTCSSGGFGGGDGNGIYDGPGSTQAGTTTVSLGGNLNFDGTYRVRIGDVTGNTSWINIDAGAATVIQANDGLRIKRSTSNGYLETTVNADEATPAFPGTETGPYFKVWNKNGTLAGRSGWYSITDFESVITGDGDGIYDGSGTIPAATTSISAGYWNVNAAGQRVSIGDVAGSSNSTYVDINDGASTLGISADSLTLTSAGNGTNRLPTDTPSDNGLAAGTYVRTVTQAGAFAGTGGWTNVNNLLASVTAGANVVVTGNGTSGSPYVISASVPSPGTVSSLVNNGDGTYTHDNGSTSVVIDTRDGVSADAGNDLSLGSDSLPFFTETVSVLAFTSSTHTLSFTDESGTTNNFVIGGVSVDANNSLSVGSDYKPFFEETLTSLTLVGGNLLRYVDENGSNADISLSTLQDGNGIYDGSGTIPASTVATATSFRITKTPSSGGLNGDTLFFGYNGFSVPTIELGMEWLDSTGGAYTSIGIDGDAGAGVATIISERTTSGDVSLFSLDYTTILLESDGAIVLSGDTLEIARGTSKYYLPTANPDTEGLSAGIYIPVVDEDGVLAGTAGWYEVTNLSEYASTYFQSFSIFASNVAIVNAPENEGEMFIVPADGLITAFYYNVYDTGTTDSSDDLSIAIAINGSLSAASTPAGADFGSGEVTGLSIAVSKGDIVTIETGVAGTSLDAEGLSVTVEFTR